MQSWQSPGRSGDVAARLPHVLGRRAVSAARRGADALLDFVYPPETWDVASLRLLDAPWCARCGFPLELPAPGAGAGSGAGECAACLARPPRYGRARAAMAYDEGSRPLVLGFKHGGRTAHLSAFALQMVRAGRELLCDGAVLVPVPLHRRRLRARRFNQAALLAGRIAHHTGLPVWGGLHRTRHTASQGTKSASARRRNVRAAFAVRGPAPAACVLVDDVMTTGATLEACALALQRAGAASVDCLTLARVVRERAPE